MSDLGGFLTVVGSIAALALFVLMCGDDGDGDDFLP